MEKLSVRELFKLRDAFVVAIELYPRDEDWFLVNRLKEKVTTEIERRAEGVL